jgi:hypothetical protein
MLNDEKKLTTQNGYNDTTLYALAYDTDSESGNPLDIELPLYLDMLAILDAKNGNKIVHTGTIAGSYKAPATFKFAFESDSTTDDSE